MTFLSPWNETKNCTKNSSSIHWLRKPRIAVQYLIKSYCLGDVLFYSQISDEKISLCKGRINKTGTDTPNVCIKLIIYDPEGRLVKYFSVPDSCLVLPFRSALSFISLCLSRQVNASVSKGCLSESIHLLLQSSVYKATSAFGCLAGSFAAYYFPTS